MATFAGSRRTRLSFQWLPAVVVALSFAAPALAQLNTGDVLASIGQGKVKRFSPTGTLLSTLDSTTGSAFDTGMCFDALGNLYVTEFSSNTVSKFNSSGVVTSPTFGTGYNSAPESCVVDAAQNLFVGQADGGRTIRKINSATGATITDFTVATESRGTDFIDLAADQCTMHYTSEGSTVKQYNVCTSTQLANFATGLGGPCYAHRIRPNGEELVACSTVVHRLSNAGAILQTYTAFTPSPSALFALNLDPDGTTFWTGDLGSGQVYRMNIATGTQATSWNSAPLSALAGLAVVGEIVVSQPTPTPTGVLATATPTVPVPSNIPTLETPTMAILGLLLATLGVLLMRRVR